MRYILAVLLMTLTPTAALSQQVEVGPFAGGANYVGDIGASTYINPNTLFGGFLFKYNASTRHSYRLSLLYTELSADDSNSRDLRRQERGYSFSTQLLEISAGLEFTFEKFNLTRSDNHGTPYLYTGVNYYFADQLTGTPQGIEKKGGVASNVSIPISLGYKRRLNSFLTGGIELGARYALTDNLDGSHSGQFNFGNPNSNDWYIFTGLYVTIFINKKACYNNFE